MKISRKVDTTKKDSQLTLTRALQSTQKYTANDPHQIKGNDLLVAFIAHNLLPLSTVESPYFRAFVNFLDPKYHLPSRKLLSHKVLREKYKSIESKILEMLKIAGNIDVALDIWSNRQMKLYIGVTY